MAITKKTSIFFLILAPIFWSTTSLFVKTADWNAWAIAGWRSLLTALFLWFCFRWVYPRKFKFDLSWPSLLVAVFYSAFSTAFAYSVKLTTAANTTFMQYTAPIYVALLTPLLLKERTPSRDWNFVAIMVLGMGLIIGLEGLNSPRDLLGLLVGMLGGICWAMTVMLLKKQGAGGMPLSGLVIGNFITAVYCFPQMISVDFLDMGQMGYVAALGLCLGLGYVVYLLALGQVTALEAAMIPAIEPLLAPTWVFFFRGEVPGRWTMIGGALILGSVLTRAWLAARKIEAAIAPKPNIAADDANPG